MSVPASKRKESKLVVLLRAYELTHMMLSITANEKIFPKRNRWQCAYDIIRYAKGIFRQLSFANSIRVITAADFIARNEHQERARLYCRYLYDEIDIAIKHQGLKHKIANTACAKLRNIEKLLNAWIKSDFRSTDPEILKQCPNQILWMKDLLKREAEFEATVAKCDDKSREGQ